MHAFDLTSLALFLFLAFLGGLFLERLRQPALVGYILVGTLIGNGFVSAENLVNLEWFGELAIILLMFMLGLELDISRFQRQMKSALGITGLQIVLGLGVMLTAGFVFAWTWQLSILFGFIVALSSTAVAIGVLRNLNLSDSPTGEKATAILVAQDLAVIPMLLVINALSLGSLDAADIVQLGFATLLIVGSLFGIYEIQRHPEIVARLESLFARGQSQAVIAGLALCFGAATLSGAVGLSTAYGAFALGLLIGNVGTVGASYRTAINPVHDLLMMMFFLSIGTRLDLAFMLEHAFVIGSILAATMLLKTVGNVIIMRLWGIPRAESWTLGSVLGQIGEFSFVLVGLGLSSGFIETDGYQIALAVIALSLVLSPLWFQFVAWRLHVRGMFPYVKSPDTSAA